jgi:hypothetical protein
MKKEIAMIGKDAQEEIRVRLTEFNGYYLVDLRVWTKPTGGEEDAEGKPTKKSLTVKPDILPELMEALPPADRDYNTGRAGKA